MRLIATFHVCALALLVCYGVLSAHRPILYTTLFWTFVVVYSGVIVGVFRGSRYFLQLSVFPPALLVALSAPTVIWNVFAFLTGHPLYLDSPGTILVVLVIAMMVTLPSTVVLAVYWTRRREVFGR
jgi:hypothetical protein